KKFNVIPLRWIVERPFAWLYNFRRIAMDYEFYSESSEAMIQIAFSKNHAQQIINLKFKQTLNIPLYPLFAAMP
ncbi:MAG: transposase, partial [Bacteroidales bacterium]|nr:transposase [Bacteroidales bacterium]